MNIHERSPLDPETAEQLLSGDRVAQRVSPRLAERLAAASAAAFPGELAGERTAVAAFHRASTVEIAHHNGRPKMIKSAVIAKLLTLKAAAIAVAAVSAGGVALAASTGVLPNPMGPANQPENPGHSVPGPAHSNGSNATPSPSLVGLCTAYLAGAGSENGNVLDNPAFGALIAAAGDEENVADYCADLGVTARDPAGSPADHPGPTDHPGSTDHPTGPPTSPGEFRFTIPPPAN